MMNVSNGKCIRRLSMRSLKAARQRNIIAVISIALTTIMFTALFTIVMSIVNGFEQSNFRQIGGYAHGGFKYLTEEQFNKLKDDPLIKEYAMRRFVGMPKDVPFNKDQVEISYCDKNAANWLFCTPEEGRLPAENTNEAAADDKVLSLLGAEPKIGTEFTVTFMVDGKETTESFTLCGRWKHDDAAVASNILIPESRAEEIFAKLGTTGEDGMTGSYNMDVMLKSKAHIEEDINDILARHGYQSQTYGDNYIATGVNWGYVSAQLSQNIDTSAVLAIAAALVLIIFTGYLIIYNVFNISVSNDIHRYGLLKTIGTTGRQIKRMVYIEALTLSAVGIPSGLLLGRLCGSVLTPVIMKQLNGVGESVSASPVIFAGAALFSIATVFISCMKPARTASKVSPIEAIRYTEGGGIKRTVRKSKKGASLLGMAAANLGRSRSKTAVTIASMSLSVVLLCVTFIFTNGFDMDKYLSDKALADYIVGDASYFRFDPSGEPLSEDAVGYIASNIDITDGGRTYRTANVVYEYVTEEWYRQQMGLWNDEETVNNLVERTEKVNGLLQSNANIYGMEQFCLDRLNVFDGDISKLGKGNYIAAVYSADDYGKINENSHWAKVGDKIKLRYVSELEYYNTETGEIYTGEIPENAPFSYRPKKYKEIEYEVAALVDVPHNLSYRYYGADQFVLSAEQFKADSGTSEIMYYAFDVPDGTDEKCEEFMAELTQKTMPELDYESKATYKAEFDGFRSMFFIMGSALSFITGLVGILNFLNAVLTGIFARQREFAVLQSVGMTGKQLKKMLVYEGLFYALGAAVSALLLSLIFSPLIARLLESMFWFFSYKFTALPILITVPFFTVLGIVLPLITYAFAAKKSIVERLRESD